jgi:putative hydrolase of the HAD superfamily
VAHDGILFDLDGVIRHWPEDLSARIERRFGLRPGSIAAAAFEPALLRQAVTGEIDDETWRAAIDRAIEETHGIPGVGRAWTQDAGIGQIDEEMLRLVDRLRGRMRVGLLSNATTRLERDLETLDLAGHFDLVCNSARMAMAKPDERIFLQAAERLGVAPDRCIVVDDTEANVEAAARAGLTAIRFTGVPPLRAELDRLDVLREPLSNATISFRPLAESDFPTIHQWRNAPHVLRWWHEPLTPAQVAEKYCPRITGREPVHCSVILVNDVPVGLIQTYRIGDFPDYAQHLPLPADAAGIDLYIGHESYLHRGLGGPILRAFLETVIFPSGITTVSIDPSVENRIAIRAYEKAGFRHLVTKQLPDEPEPTYLMVLTSSL